jgi:hypothetical protein
MGENYSQEVDKNSLIILQALTVERYLSLTVYEGVMTPSLLKKFIDEIVNCSPALDYGLCRYPGPRSIVVLPAGRIPNVYIPLSDVSNLQELMEMLESRKSKVEYLPQYSPDFSPISFAFTDIKSIVKKPMRPHDDVKKWATMVSEDAAALEPSLIRNSFDNCQYPSYFY